MFNLMLRLQIYILNKMGNNLDERCSTLKPKIEQLIEHAKLVINWTTNTVVKWEAIKRLTSEMRSISNECDDLLNKK